MQLWTYEHFISYVPAIIVMIAAAVVMRICLFNKNEWIRLLPVQIIGSILVIIEIGKQIASVDNGEYNLYSIPLHYCSLLLFFIPAAAFWRGKHTNAVRTLAVTFGSALFLFMAIYPDLIYSSGNVENYFTDYLSFHTVTFHVLASGAFVFMLLLDFQKPNLRRDLPIVLIGTAAYCVVASVMAQILKTNFNNFYTCNIAPLESLRVSITEAVGYGLAQTIYVLIVVLLNLAFTTLAYMFYVGLCKLKVLIFKK